MQKATQQLTNHSQLGNTRRDIARAKTIQAEQKRGRRRPAQGCREEDRSEEMNADVTTAPRRRSRRPSRAPRTRAP